MDAKTENLVDECKRQEESCLYTSVTLFEWLKSMRFWRAVFVVAPIVFGSIATWSLLTEEPAYKWVTGISALLASIAPAVYKALDLDVSLGVIADHAHKFKILQDRFRQAGRIGALGDHDDFKDQFYALMVRMDEARSSSLTPPERFFKKAQKKIGAGHYDFAVDR